MIRIITPYIENNPPIPRIAFSLLICALIFVGETKFSPGLTYPKLFDGFLQEF